VQIYEAVMGDRAGAVTRGLMRAAAFLKDNRIPPRGFTTSHRDFATTAIRGKAAKDPDFNGDGENEGSGADTVRYRVRGAPGRYRVTINLCYQSVTPRFVDRLSSYRSPEIARFRQLHRAAEKAPLIMKTVTFHTRPAGP
jgi:hypothetical protein